MSVLASVALCLLVVDAAIPPTRAERGSAQRDGARAGDDVQSGVDAAVSAWRCNELSDEQLTARFVALGRPAEPHVLRLLAAALESPPAAGPTPLPVTALVAALSCIGGAASLGPLVNVLNSTAAEERVAAAQALGELRLAGGLVPLLDALDDESILVRAAAGASALALAADQPDFELVDALEARWSGFVRRDQLGIVLGRLGTDDARRVLRSHLRWSHGEGATLAALGGLWLCADQSDGEAVLEVLGSTSSLAVRRKACLLLGKLGHGPAVRALIDLLHDDSRGLVNDAHWALKRITGQPLRAEAALWESWWERAGEPR